jgi:hypothetical protein
MWILQWLPNWIFYAFFLVGVLGLAATFVMKFIPFVYVYKTPIQMVSIILIALGTYMAGAISNNEQWEARVKELQIKVAEAQAKAAEENVKIVEKVVNNTKIVKERGEEVIKYVEKEVIKYDTKFIAGGECEIPKEFIISLNKAATPPDAKK